MIQLQNDRLLRTIRRESVDRTPIWIMRQAGRYLPEYRNVREQAGSFLTLCKTPQLACEVTLQPLKRFPLDAAIIFSDILTIPDAMGLGLYFKEGEGPGFERPVRTEKDVQALRIPDPESELGYVLDAIRLTHQELAGKVPLIGFCGSPWTLATYMVEGSANKNFPLIKAMLKENPRLLHQLLDILAQSVALHLNAQISAGAEVVMIFDTWGGMLNTEDYLAFSLNSIRQVISKIKTHPANKDTPIILFTKNGAKWLEPMSETGCDVVGLDWTISLDEARRRVGDKVVLQGNLNPSILLSSPDNIRSEVHRILQEYGSGSGHIFNLGHGITPDIDPERVAVLVDAVHTFSQRA